MDVQNVELPAGRGRFPAFTKMKRWLFTIIATAISIYGLDVIAAAGEPVDVALVLAIDSSSSVSDRELLFQKHAIADALTSPEVISAIKANPYGRIAVTYVFWGDANYENDAGEWTTISGRDDAAVIADIIRSRPRKVYGNTSVGQALISALNLLSNYPRVAARKVVDISGDGSESVAGRRRAKLKSQSHRVSLRAAREEALARGVTINALAIETTEPHLADWYRKSVIAGPDSFVVAVTSQEAFYVAFRTKLDREIRWQPAVALKVPADIDSWIPSQI